MESNLESLKGADILRPEGYMPEDKLNVPADERERRFGKAGQPIPADRLWVTRFRDPVTNALEEHWVAFNLAADTMTFLTTYDGKAGQAYSAEESTFRIDHTILAKTKMAGTTEAPHSECPVCITLEQAKVAGIYSPDDDTNSTAVVNTEAYLLNDSKAKCDTLGWPTEKKLKALRDIDCTLEVRIGSGECRLDTTIRKTDGNWVVRLIEGPHDSATIIDSFWERVILLPLRYTIICRGKQYIFDSKAETFRQLTDDETQRKAEFDDLFRMPIDPTTLHNPRLLSRYMDSVEHFNPKDADDEDRILASMSFGVGKSETPPVSISQHPWWFIALKAGGVACLWLLGFLALITGVALWQRSRESSGRSRSRSA